MQIYKLLIIVILLVVNISAQKNSLIFLGDSQRTNWIEIGTENNSGIAKRIFDKIAEENPELVVHLGDIVFYGSSKNSWQSFDEDAAKVVEKKIPFFCIPGNHDYFGSNKQAMENITSRFPSLKNKTWYSITQNDVAIILFNSNFGELAKKEYLAQIQWYKKELEKFQNDPSIKHIIAGCHHSPYTNSKIVNPNEDVQKYYVKPFLKTPKAKLFISGHCHSYEHFTIKEKHFIVSGGGGGPRQKLEIDPDKRKYQDKFVGPEVRFFHFCRITTNKDSVLVEVVKMDSNYNFSIADVVSIP